MPSIVATGEFVSPVRSELSPKMPGRVAKMYVDEGSRVSKGQPVLAARDRLRRASTCSPPRRTSARAKAALDEARRDLERKKELIGEGLDPAARRSTVRRPTYDQASAALRRRERAGVAAPPADRRRHAALAGRRHRGREAHRRRRAPRRSRRGRGRRAALAAQAALPRPRALPRQASPSATSVTATRRSVSRRGIRRARSRPSAASSIRRRAPCSPRRSSRIATAGCGRDCSPASRRT